MEQLIRNNITDDLTGLGSASGLGILTSESRSIDMLGNQSASRVYLDPAARTLTQVTDTPDSVLDAIQVSVNGVTQRSVSPTGVTNSFAYDALRSVSPTGVTNSYAYDSLRRQIALTDGRGNTSITHYDSNGRVDWTADAANATNRFVYDTFGRRVTTIDPLGQATHTAYDFEGRVIATWGATYPVAYEYDQHGRMTAMATTRNPTNDFATLAAELAGGTSLVSLASPMSLDLTTWLYDQPTGLLTNKLYADGRGPSYTYTPDGKLATRTWARGVTTTYAYDPSGSLTNIAYSDSTPDVAFTYDRLGRQKVAQTFLSAHHYAYDPATLALTTETVIAGSETNVLSRTQDALGRSSGFSLGQDYAVQYGYDTYGRFCSVTSGLSVVNYSYLPGTDLLAGWTAGPLTVSRSFEPHRDLLTQVRTMAGTNLISRFDYANDALARRTQRVDNSAVTNDFGYNLRSEVTSAAMGTNAYGYVFDSIGNRREASRLEAAQAVTNLYASNSLNQYTNIVVQPTAYSLQPSHDLDGNLTNDGVRVYLWDAENRLIGVDPPVIEPGAISVRYAYDYMSRRVARAAYRWLGSNAYETVETGTYLYDGWNNIRELTHSQTHTLTNSYIWGLDLSGTLQGAGGIGGLLAASLGGTTSVSSVFFAYDGNGNVTDLVDTNGALVAHYEFDPFGRMVAAEGDEASSNPFRFSTKHWDDATGLGYWGYRWYEPESGRWTSKDRIAEMGGRNLYRYVGNAIMNAIDVLGLIQLSDPPTDDELRKLRAILLKDLVAKEYKGTPESAKAMTHFLEGSGETYDFGYDFFADSSAGKRALKENQDRVKQAIKDFLLHELRDGKSKRLLEYWDRQESSGLWEMEADFYTAVKGFTLTTYLAGTGVRTKGGCFTFTGVVDHLFWDYYDFNQGTKFPWGEEIGTLPCDYLILMNERKMASNMWTQGEGSQSVKAQGKDKLLWRYNFEIIFGGVNDGSGGAKDEVIKKYPKAKRMAKIPRPKGRRDL